ncbi:hypothetical protein MKW94_029539 [Papaver nudicaule]|uniref:X8 domain-containing protein n=1 Tax=Papaver nudicaule TaxID=74823 RepID=A0AA42AVJ9_PAPNU|nr:hypothetical protein [Papaver nudicaule]
MSVVLVLPLLIIFAFTSHSADAVWCACRPDKSDVDLQKAIDFACGNGADCAAINQGGACYQPNTVRAHCSYAVNSYYQKQKGATGSCEFSGTAAVTSSDPSPGGSCSFTSGGFRKLVQKKSPHLSLIVLVLVSFLLCFKLKGLSYFLLVWFFVDISFVCIFHIDESRNH